MGFALAAMACALRGRWAGGGVLIALAVLSQQFALLVAAPLLILVPSVRRWRFVGSAAGAAALVVLPLSVASSGNAWRAVTLGSGNNPSIGGTALWELSHRGPAVVVGSRVLPVVLALALSWWVARRLGPAALSAPAMISLVAASLSLRLIFEQNLFSYYFMALVVVLVLVDVAGGRIRGSLVAWLATLLMVFCLDGYFLRVGSGVGVEKILPLLVLLVAFSLCLFGLVVAPSVVDLESPPLVGCRRVRRRHLARARQPLLRSAPDLALARGLRTQRTVVGAGSAARLAAARTGARPRSSGRRRAGADLRPVGPSPRTDRTETASVKNRGHEEALPALGIVPEGPALREAGGGVEGACRSEGL